MNLKRKISRRNAHTELVRLIVREMNKFPGVMVWKNQSGSVIREDGIPLRFGLKGSADIIGAVNGKPVGLEVKTGEGKQTMHQRIFQNAFERAGGIYKVCRSLDDALEVVE